MMKKEALFFSTDALIALIVIFLTILVIYPTLRYPTRELELHEDVMKVMSNLKVGETSNDYVQSLILEGKITDLNKSLLEQIGEFYVTDRILSQQLAEAILSELNTSENIGIWIGDSLIAARNLTPYEEAKNIEVVTQYVSGIKEGESIKGFSSRAWLSNTLQKKYFYFGGYVGEGNNITVSIEYSGDISSAEMELAISKDFEVYVNGVSSGSYSKSDSEFKPKNYSLPITNFYSGINSIVLRGGNFYIAGGYIAITYQPYSWANFTYEQVNKRYFPGVEGVINLYDGFYVPGQLNSLEILLHLNSSYPVFLIIGNTTIFNESTNGEATINFTDSIFQLIGLNYSDLSQKTIPLRLGLENVSYLAQREADVFSVTDLSGSMCGTCTNVTCGVGTCCGFVCGVCYANEPQCLLCGGNCTGGIAEAKQANKEFIDVVLNVSGNREGLVGYRTSVLESDTYNLSNDNVVLKNKVDSWIAAGNTCTCCGINRAVNYLLNESSDEKFKSIVVMSDGIANVYCNQQGTGNAKNDSINAACDAYNNYSIKFYTIGFGPQTDEATLQAIATCGNGSYYYSTIEDISDIYTQLAEELLEAQYKEQTIEVTGNLSTTLYPDSYIKFSHAQPSEEYGLITTTETKFYDEYYGNFSVPLTSRVLEAKAISYSGARWTDNVEINGNSVYNLSNYGEDYTRLGDPYVIDIPPLLVQENNTVKVSTGISLENSTVGSINNKIIYILLQNLTSYSGKISPNASGCNWTIQFEDDSSGTFKIPTNYSGSETCNYEESGVTCNGVTCVGSNDAIQIAVYNLLRLLDFNLNEKADVKFLEQNLQISSNEIIGIPYAWSTKTQVRKWY